MNSKRIFNISLIVLLLIVLILVSPAQSAPTEANALTGYYNLLGYEGIGTLGSGLTSNGPIPPVADYVTTHCRYINVPNTTVGHYYLRYPLDLPNGANITKVSLHIADFHAGGIVVGLPALAKMEQPTIWHNT